jgi:signal transduction histidine kinase/CheY-like chemotaxis protein
MRRRIIISLLSLFALFAVGGTAASWYVSSATDQMRRLVDLHEVEGLRRNLVISVQAVQADLYTARTPLTHDLDEIVANVAELDASAEECASCHHSPLVEEQIEELRGLVDEYETALSYYITAAANRERIGRIMAEAATVGNHILQVSEGMSATASLSLGEIAKTAASRIDNVRILLLVTPVLATCLGVAIFLYLARSVASPVQRLVSATRVIASGDLGHRVRNEEEAEFAELARHFNAMGAALEKSYQRLQSANEDLRREIGERQQAEREREELQDLLLQMQKMEALGRLSAGIAHEFNNFLQVIRGCADRMARRRGAEAGHEPELDMIADTTERGANLTRQLLVFGAKAEGEPIPIDMNRSVRKVRAMLERIFPESIEIQVSLSEAIHAVMADPAQIEQVLLNLALNARDAMPDGGVLRMETHRGDDGGRASRTSATGENAEWVVLRVSDNGHGMDDETVRNVFDPFFTTKGVGVGTGLGLATAYGIVRSCDGEIECKSEVGRGTVFEVRLRALPGVSVTVRAKETPPTEPLRGTGTILFVDDEEAVVKVMSESLEEYGYAVHTAGSGEEALEFFHEHGREVDLVVLDLGMPGMGGRACLERLLEIDPDTKVVISTAYSTREGEREMAKSGARGFLAKPYPVSELLREVASVLTA